MGKKRSSLAGIAAVGAMALAGPAAADAAIAVYPAGGSSFTGSAQGWVGSGASCAPAAGLDIACSTNTEYSSSEGNPAGSINSRIDVLVNAGGLLQGRTTWTSPNFAIPPGSSPAKAAAVALDRRLDGALALSPQSTYTVNLIDRTEGNRATTVLTEAIDETDGTFGRNAGAVPASALVAGHTYALSINTTTTTRAARVGLLGSLNTRYDNVVLAVDDTAPGTGLSPIGDGASGTTGVTVTGPALSNTALRSLLGSINPDAEAGKGAGGSVVPAAKCTILGTARNDRVKGTKGNDVICGLGGNDRIDGGGGNDVIDTGNGNDIATGGTGAGKDTLIGVRGKDRLGGGASADRLTGASDNDRIHGGSSSDRLTGSSSNDRLTGSSSNDRLAGAAGKDRLNAGKGNDRLSGGKGADRLVAGAGKDRISARDRSRDLIDGGSGRDTATVDRRARAGRKGVSRKRADRIRRVERVR